MTTSEHTFMLGSNFLDDEITSGCTCGWEVNASDEGDAVDKWENHCDAVFMEATEVTP